jgi:tRNA/rRNA methyltransferase
VLVGTSHPGNVGAAARAMRAMGLRRLVLASPRDPRVCSHPEAIARASRADDVLAAARIVPSLSQALADSTLAIAVSAETREFGPPAQDPQACVHVARDELAAHPSHRVSFVFGAERTGLSIDEVGLCQALCTIPGEDDYQSLNLAQAVQVVAWLRSHPGRPCSPSGRPTRCLHRRRSHRTRPRRAARRRPRSRRCSSISSARWWASGSSTRATRRS